MKESAKLAALLGEAQEAAVARDYARAERLLGLVLAAQPCEIRALDLLGFVLFFQGRYAEAERACRRVLDLDSRHAYAHKGLGLCLARQGRVEEGVACLEEAIRIEPRWFDPRWDLAVVFKEAARILDALRVLREAESELPEHRGRYSAFREELEVLL
ncbi:MAG: tetratricopeptide repeat protein [Polyangiaceae bacterium]